MSYAIIRNENYKRDNLPGLYKHDERKNTNYSNKEIDKNKSKYNYSIKQCPTTYAKALKNLIEENKLKGRLIKTTNVACEYVITASKEFFDSVSETESKRYFQTAYDFVCQYKDLGEKYIISAKVHMDETTPHMHLVYVPVVHKPDGDKITCSEFWKGKDSYKNLQDEFYEYIKERGFNLERGNHMDTKHINVETLKQITNYENIKHELQDEIDQSVDKDNYIKKLKVLLAKASTAVSYAEYYEQENNALREELHTVKKENRQLKTYIQKMFEVVQNIFYCSMDKFKKIIDTYIKIR